jgi:hypothetical protein
VSAAAWSVIWSFWKRSNARLKSAGSMTGPGRPWRTTVERVPLSMR